MTQLLSDYGYNSGTQGEASANPCEVKYLTCVSFIFLFTKTKLGF